MSFVELLEQLSLEEKASLLEGGGFWATAPVERLGIPSITMTDGPHGLRRSDPGPDGRDVTTPATCFPPMVALGSTWDRDLVHRVGQAIATEAIAQGVSIVLGPGINLKRSPLGGRNFEFVSEDPLLAGEMGVALVEGLQSRGVGASLKHYALNNQETDRLFVSADVDPRPLHEMYLRAFERVVRDAQPWTVMASYNKVNGTTVTEHHELLTRVLRETWGFEGAVISDWGAVRDRVASLQAGLDLEMPTAEGRGSAAVVAAVQEGTLSEADVDRAVARVLRLVDQAAGITERPASDDDAHHQLAREAAARSVVLLKNDQALLPLQPGTRLAVIGAFAEDARYQGGGSSRVNPTRVDHALDALRADAEVTFAPGFSPDGAGDAGKLRAQAVEAARDAEVAVCFLGLPPSDESEGFDRETLALPADQLELVRAVVAANPRTVVVLSAGSAVELPFADEVPAIVYASLLGQAGGGATADVLFGRVNPSGRLGETFPLRLADTPTYGFYPGQLGSARHNEGVLVGYRWYDTRDVEVRYPFGHGLSYTSFSYGDAHVTPAGDGDLLVRVPVTNDGPVAGREVVQVYVGHPDARQVSPRRQLAGFTVVELEPGQTADVEVRLERRDLGHWDERVGDWRGDGGRVLVEVGTSSRDIRQRVDAELEPWGPFVPFTFDSPMADLVTHPLTAEIAQQALDVVAAEFTYGNDEAFDMSEVQRIAASFPVEYAFKFTLPFSRADLAAAIDRANAAGDQPPTDEDLTR